MCSLHTYVEVTDAGDASNVFVKGLEGKTYIDKALDIAEPQREKAGETLTFGDGVGLFDRVFLATEPETMLHVGAARHNDRIVFGRQVVYIIHTLLRRRGEQHRSPKGEPIWCCLVQQVP